MQVTTELGQIALANLAILLTITGVAEGRGLMLNKCFVCGMRAPSGRFQRGDGMAVVAGGHKIGAKHHGLLFYLWIVYLDIVGNR
jgi:hypothetical protein